MNFQFVVTVIPCRVKQARKNLHLTQRALAKRIKMSPQTLSAIETRGADVRMSTVQALCHVLRVSPNYLTGYEAHPEPLDGYVPIPGHDPTACAPHCNRPCSDRLLCPDCAETIAPGQPHPIGDCIRRSYWGSRRNMAFLAQRHSLPLDIVRDLCRLGRIP